MTALPKEAQEKCRESANTSCAEWDGIRQMDLAEDAAERFAEWAFEEVCDQCGRTADGEYCDYFGDPTVPGGAIYCHGSFITRAEFLRRQR